MAEPERGVAVDMLRSVVPMMEAHHGVVVLDEAVHTAVTLSQRYIPARQLPDKAVSLLDTAAARVAVSQHAVPAPVEDRRRRLELLEIERGVVERETSGHYRRDDRLAGIDAEIDAARETVIAIEAKWTGETAALAQVRSARDALAADGDPAALETALAALAEAAGDDPMVFGVVDADAIAAVVGEWTGIPVGRMVKDEIASVLTIADRLKQRVVGQDHAMDAIAKRIQTSRAKLDNPLKPVGVFMLCGPSGVGKTETAHALADLLFSGDDSMIVINMSEFQEAHTVSTLKGAPAGYVGYGQGGVLTEAVRRRPYSVVLLDEIEKAHPDVHEMFFQVFDKGFMNDAEGRRIDFRNTIILLTSNVGTDLIMSLTDDEETAPERGSAGECAAARTTQGVPARAARAVAGAALLSAQQRDAGRHRSSPARPNRAADRREPRNFAGDRRGRGRPHRRALHRSSVGRPHDRRDIDQHHAARNVGGVAGTQDARGGGTAHRYRH